VIAAVFKVIRLRPYYGIKVNILLISNIYYHYYYYYRPCNWLQSDAIAKTLQGHSLTLHTAIMISTTTMMMMICAMI